jgi:hypothetical protein
MRGRTIYNRVTAYKRRHGRDWIIGFLTPRKRVD